MNRFLKGVVVYSAILLLAITLLTVIARGALQRKSSSRADRVTELFNRNCARCHGGDGRGETPLGRLYKSPDFTDPRWWEKNSKINSSTTLRSIVTRGKAGMPAFGKKLTKAEIKLLVNHVRSFRKSRNSFNPERKN
jgi:mono/diheme cytochrome c family protein